MRIDLNVPYAEKDRARRLGAKWDAARRTWYVKDATNLQPFLRWMPVHLRAAHSSVATVAVKPLIGEGYQPLPCEWHCKTPPWEDCPGCEHWLRYNEQQITAAAERMTGAFPKF